MFCSRCGRTLPPNAKTCPFCGSPVDASRYCQFCDKPTRYDSSSEPETTCRSCGEILGAGSLGGYCRHCLKDPKTYQKAQERVQLQKSAASQARSSDQGRVKTTLEQFSQAAEQVRPKTFRSRTTSSSRDARAKKGRPRGCLVTIVFLLIFFPMLISIIQLAFEFVEDSFDSPRPEPAVPEPSYSAPAYEDARPAGSPLDDPDYRKQQVYDIVEMDIASNLAVYADADAQFLSITFDDELYFEDYGQLWCSGLMDYSLDGSSLSSDFTACIMVSEYSYYVVYLRLDDIEITDQRELLDSFGCLTPEGAEVLGDYGYEAGDPIYDLDDPIYIVY